jgi:phage protein U
MTPAEGTLGGAFGTFGPITFTVVGSPTNQEIINAYHYAKIDVMQQRPVLQWIFDDLQVIRLSIMLHYMWCSPGQVIQVLYNVAKQHQAQPLTIGPQNYGNFLIQELDEKDTWRADNGNLLVATLKIQLIEYAGPVPAQGPQPSYAGTSSAQTGSAVAYAPQPVQAPPTTNYLGVSLQDAVRMGGNAITLAGDL